MKKDELLASIKSTQYIDAMGEPKLQTINEFGDKYYIVNIRKINVNKVNYENISFVVIDDGGPSEAAYFLKDDTIAFENKQENYDELAKAVTP